MSKYDPVSEGRINCIEKDGVTEEGWRGGVYFMDRHHSGSVLGALLHRLIDNLSLILSLLCPTYNPQYSTSKTTIPQIYPKNRQNGQSR